ncbi:Carbohydrate-binding domain family 9-like protein [Akanthomyces lecanii RCEF 1005]|uniref:Carbohydrate-binding domain family 9-like protein n=1 Tax=Akanthomyces lecanii RCEF 1005 TaxID=1081108 RepID=A0A162JI45_CORDF|nr:Carbohydrate-binding domain family 9-like protein [Akanthomyces lecanii RCEF 1005]
MKPIISTALAGIFTYIIHYASATSVSYCTGDANDICYSWGVASASGSSQSLLLQIEASTKYQWVALGTGSRMSGSDMFVIYQDGSGNVTLSPRKGSGHNTPGYGGLTAVALAAGSGVAKGKMTASIDCGSCAGVDLTGSDSWIGAWKTGGALDATDVSANIGMHDGTDQFTINLAKATMDSGNNSLSTNSGASTTSDSSSNTVSGDGASRNVLVYSHRILMSVVFIIGYPLGGLLMPLMGKWILHASWQVVMILAMCAGFAVGEIASDRLGMWFNEPHVQLGTIICAMMSFQVALGWMHHRNYAKYQRRSWVSYCHIWYGRALIIVGIVNGGIGLKVSRAPMSQVVAYSVVAAIVFALYGAIATYRLVKPRENKMVLSSSSSICLNERSRWN